MSKNKQEDLIISDIESLQKEFYNTYNPDYWLNKINLIATIHDNFDTFEQMFSSENTTVSSEFFKRTLRTELHFLYFQMTETLFEIIFALLSHDNRDLWLALTFSNDIKTKYYTRTYSKIEEFSLSLVKPWTGKTKKITRDNKEQEIPLLQWLFYLTYPSKISPDEWSKNLKMIERILVAFARDFSNRGEYNAYKHSLRFYNTPYSMALSSMGMQQVKINMGSSKDSIVFLEKYKKRNSDGEMISTNMVARTIKPFDFERDVNCCLLIHSLLSNIILTRKYSLLEELHGEKFDFFTFNNIQYPQLIIPNTGISRSSFTV